MTDKSNTHPENGLKDTIAEEDEKIFKELRESIAAPFKIECVGTKDNVKKLVTWDQVDVVLPKDSDMVKSVTIYIKAGEVAEMLVETYVRGDGKLLCETIDPHHIEVGLLDAN